MMTKHLTPLSSIMRSISMIFLASAVSASSPCTVTSVMPLLAGWVPLLRESARVLSFLGR